MMKRSTVGLFWRLPRRQENQKGDPEIQELREVGEAGAREAKEEIAEAGGSTTGRGPLGGGDREEEAKGGNQE